MLVAILLSVNRIIRIVGYGWVSPLSRRFGANQLTAAACAAGAVSTLAYGLLSGFVLLFVARQGGQLDDEEQDVDDDQPFSDGGAIAQAAQETWALAAVVVAVVDPHDSPRRQPVERPVLLLPFYHTPTC